MSSQESIWYNRKSAILSQLSEHELERLNTHTTRIQKVRGEIIWDEFEDNPRLYIVDKGYIRIYRINEEGKKVVLSFLGPGEFFGAISPNLSTFAEDECMEVIRNIRLIAIDAPVFHEVLKNHPEMMMRIMGFLERRARGLEKRISNMLFKDTCARTAELLIEVCEKYGEACPEQNDKICDVALTHQEIADMVGATRPVVSGIISDMLKAGIVQKHDRVLCLSNLKALQALAQDGVKAFARISD